jgi:hypothetical protein
MQTVGTTTARPVPRKPRRRRLSRRRLTRRIIVGALVAAVVVVGFMPTLRYFGLVHSLGPRVATNRWEVVSIAANRRSAVIKVDTCHAELDGVDVMRVEHDVRLTVYVRQEHGFAPVSCPAVSRMPTHRVQFGLVLPVDGTVLASGCPKRLCPPD